MSRYGVLVPDMQRTTGKRMAAFYGFGADASMQRCSDLPAEARSMFCNKYVSGDKSPEIAAAQQALTKLGYNPGPADGILGPNTIAALAKYTLAVDQAFMGGLSQGAIVSLKAGVASYRDPTAGQSLILTGGGGSVAPVKASVTGGGIAVVGSGAASGSGGGGGLIPDIGGPGGPSKTTVIAIGVGALALGGLIWLYRKKGQVPVLQGLFDGVFGRRRRRHRGHRR